MEKKGQTKGVSAFLRDLEYSFPFLRPFLSVFITFQGELYKQIWPPTGHAKSPQPISRFDIAMMHLNYIMLNGALITVPVVLLLQTPFRFEYIFGFGVARYLANDLLKNLLWKPLVDVAKSFKLR